MNPSGQTVRCDGASEIPKPSRRINHELSAGALTECRETITAIQRQQIDAMRAGHWWRVNALNHVIDHRLREARGL